MDYDIIRCIISNKQYFLQNISMAESFYDKGIKSFDALHIAAAIDAKCDYFLTTDKKLLNTNIDGIKIVSPIQFILDMEENNDAN